MKAGKIVLAILLAAGAVLAYVYFPNPLERAAAETDKASTPADSH